MTTYSEEFIKQQPTSWQRQYYAHKHKDPNAWFWLGRDDLDPRKEEKVIDTGALDEVVVTAKRPVKETMGTYLADNLKKNWEKDGDKLLSNLETAAGFVPYLGDALDIKNVGIDLKNGNYGAVLAGVGLLALPNWLEKPGKWALRKLKDIPYKSLFNKLKHDDLFKIAPEYKKFIQDNPQLDPNSQEALDAFFKIQGKSTRGVTGKNKIEDALTQIGNITDKGEGMDIQHTNGGLYTSNSPYIAEQFSINRKATPEDNLISAVGDLQYGFDIDKSLSLADQMKQYKNQIAYLSNKHGSIPSLGIRDLVQRLGKSKAVAFEAPYGVNRSNIPTHERIYISGENPKIIDLKQTIGIDGKTRKRGAGAADVKISGDYFYPYELGSLGVDRITKGLNYVQKAAMPTLFTASGFGLAGIVPYLINKPEYSWFNIFDKPTDKKQHGGTINYLNIF